MKTLFYLRYVTRAARRDGLRTLLAVLCVAIGVMSIVALQLIGNMVNTGLTGNIRDLNGGDLDVSGVELAPNALRYFDQLEAQGLLTSYTAVASYQGSAESPHPVSRFNISLVDPAHYPLAGAPTFLRPSGNVRLSAILSGATIVLTNSLAQVMDARVGDSFTVILADGHEARVMVGGIVANAGLFQQPFLLMAYDSLLVFHESSTRPLLYSDIYADVPGHSAAHVTTALHLLQGQFADANIVTSSDLLQNNLQEVNGIQSFLRIVGLVALLIGGMGIINTMQVLLRRRNIEIAILKAGGYTARDLAVLFGMQAATLGLSGGVIGALAAIPLSFAVRGYVEQAFLLSLPFSVDPAIVIQGVLIGVAVSLIFGLLPVAEASQVRPIALLRELPEGTRVMSRAAVALLGLLALALFYLLAFTILQNAVSAAILVASAVLVAAVLNLIFRLAIGAVGAISRLPASGGGPDAGTVKLALRNLGRQRGRTVTTQIALFVGVFSVGLILVLGQSLEAQYSGGGIGVNAVIWTTALTPVEQRLTESRAVTRVDVYRDTSFAPMAINGRDITAALAAHQYDQDGLAPLDGILGFDLAHGRLPEAPDFTLVSGRMLNSGDAGTRNVVVDEATRNAPLGMRLGERITVQYLDKRSFLSGGRAGGTPVTCTIVGFYQNNTGVVSLQETLLGDYTLVDAIGGSNALFELGIHVDPPRADALLTQIQTALPGQVFVHSYVDLSAQVENYLQNLILVLEILVLPALLAAAANVANAVALATLDRQRELAIQKVLGHTSRDVLGQIVLEQGVAALVAGLAAMLLVIVTTLVSGPLIANNAISRPGALTMPTVVGVVAASVLLGIAVTILVSWRAAHQRPLEVLRYQ